MPLLTIHLLSLTCPLPTFLQTLSSTPLKPLIVARVIRWIILPTTLSTDPLLAQNTRWDLLLLAATDALPSDLTALLANHWSVTAGVPSRLVEDFAARNARLLRPEKGDVPPLTGALDAPRTADSAQSLELTAELQEWMRGFGAEGQPGRGAVSMLNLLAFKEGMKEEYLKYGAAFAESVGKRRGGVAKVVGTVVGTSDGAPAREGQVVERKGWDEIAVAHYPSIWHFADMLASRDYQEVNHRHRVGSLRDTFILCTSELDLPLSMGVGRKEDVAAKL